MTFNCGETPYSVPDVTASLEDKFSIIWYYDGQNWLSYDPVHPELATLTEFNDKISNPYFVNMLASDRLEIACETGCYL